MPFVSSRVSVSMTEQQKDIIKEKLGRTVYIVPEKPERWLMLEFVDNCDIYFGGDNEEPSAFIEIKVFGKIPEACLDEMTKAVCKIYESDLHIKKDRIYVKYEEADKWGWNGKNF